ncbi:hypothetical protein JQ581_30040 [Bradyrhizobium liaoningense]|uniref:hypothetical protein n=1 Tax=Bradyrhizobium liaoningense TaxID=43992 RepID=UPI001BA98184|nr:hypothetical protein [Bradyrhizobium liaoningense]MBR0741181.1 hypothetical protein [Bradyrhizobium liaoningense]
MPKKPPKPPEPMDGAQLDAALIQLYGEASRQTAFARTIGTMPRTVRRWVSGDQPVPRHIAMLVNLMIDTKTKPEALRP